MGAFVGTKEAAALLGVRPGTLSKAVWDGRLAEPMRGPGNVRLWSQADLERAARVLRGQSLESIMAARRDAAAAGVRRD